MKPLFLLAALLSTVAMLFTSASPTQACECGPATAEEQVNSADLVVVGEVVSLTDPGALIEVDHYLRGSGAAAIEVGDFLRWSSACHLFGEASIDQRFVLFVQEASAERGAPLMTSLCTGSVQLTGDEVDEPSATAYLDEVEAVTGPGDAPEGTGFPREAFWALAFVLPLAFLAAATFSPWRRG